MPERLPPRSEGNEHVKAADFEENLNSVQFDEKAVKDEMYEILKNSKGFTKIRDEMFAEANHAGQGTRVDDVDVQDYVRKQGGEIFLKQIYNRGLAGLRRDFRNQKAKLKTNIARLNSDKDDFKTRSFQKSGLAEKIRDVAKESGVSVQDLTFEQAFDKNLFGDYLRPNIKGIVEYGLSWYEYSNRVTRKAALARRKQSKDIALAVVPVEKGEERPVKVPKPPEVRPQESGETDQQTYDQAQHDLVLVAEPRLQRFIADNYTNTGFKFTFSNNMNVLKIMNGEDDVAIISIKRELGGGVVFIFNRNQFTDINQACDKAIVQLKSYVKRKNQEFEVARQAAEADEVLRKANEHEERQSRVRQFLLSNNGKDNMEVAENTGGPIEAMSASIKCDFMVRVGGSRVYYGELNEKATTIKFKAFMFINNVQTVVPLGLIQFNNLVDEGDIIRKIKKLPSIYDQLYTEKSGKVE